MSATRARTAVLVAAALAAIAGCGPTASFTIVAENVAFEPGAIEVPAGRPFELVLENRDASIPHAFTLSTRTSGVLPTQLWTIEPRVGPDRRSVGVDPLAAGPYLLSCPVHPNMQVELDAI